MSELTDTKSYKVIRTPVKVKPPKRINATYSPTIRVATGDVNLPLLTLVYIEESGEYFMCTHEKLALPDVNKMTGTESGDQHNKNLKYTRISTYMAIIIEEAIYEHEKVQSPDLNPYTFLVAWCLSKGVNLLDYNI